ncbi:hypothetical protein SCLCIDRAFT_399265 [Scleroderma citrinum Foug A]|uniref:Uncharacterized protein n=1 Tax=Scleroderma citrinum Foug A TaxID=1036808 RepID=A0A0C2ZXE3_9AGAM|nr:hypothetical protein SCLCIDRAFT_399265 [Scleroderma citrinum Foug A]
MPKKNRKTADTPSSQRSKSHGTLLSRLRALMSPQRSPHPTPSASGGTSVFTRFQRRRKQEAEGLPHTPEPFVANPTTSAGNEGPSAAFEEPMAADLENDRAVVLKHPSSTGTGETTGKGRAASTHEVPGDIQPVPTVLGDAQDASVDSVAGPAQIAADTTGQVDSATTQLDAITTAYRQTLSTFSTVVNGITGIHPSAQMALSALNRTSKVATES